MKCCTDCFINEKVKKLVIKEELIGNCDFCNSQDVNVCYPTSIVFNEVRNIVSGLNVSTRGFEIDRFLTKQINFLNPNLSVTQKRDLIFHICRGTLTREDTQKKFVSNYNTSHLVREWLRFKESIKHQNRFGFDISERLKKALEEIIQKNSHTINGEQIFFRARLGIPEGAIHSGYSGSQIMAPPPNKVSEGRLNPRGISYLYISDDRNTAIAEVRPYKGKSVSVAKVKTVSDITVSCFDNTSFFYKPNLSDQVDIYLLTNYLNIEFSRPVDDQTKYFDYIPTQYVSELAKVLGIEGLRYSSALESGTNYCIFNPSKLKFISSSVATIKNVQLEVEMPFFYDLD